jgi:magnesium-transporting ATPase (P-type)
VRIASTNEALGHTDVLCFGKTGTLTDGRISPQQVSDGHDWRTLDALTPPAAPGRHHGGLAGSAVPRGACAAPVLVMPEATGRRTHRNRCACMFSGGDLAPYGKRVIVSACCTWSGDLVNDPLANSL